MRLSGCFLLGWDWAEFQMCEGELASSGRRIVVGIVQGKQRFAFFNVIDWRKGGLRSGGIRDVAPGTRAVLCTSIAYPLISYTYVAFHLALVAAF